MEGFSCIEDWRFKSLMQHDSECERYLVSWIGSWIYVLET